ncbi:MAG: PilZ domain-containing protein [Deltaproteobacteria bacterium]|nr:PilZ domain-containing protein [Deltaproteobacteria bacterium]
MTPCWFSHHGEIIYAMCLVEEREEKRFLLQVLREIGRVSLIGLQAGAEGQLEIDDLLIPMDVLQVALPWIAVVSSPEQSRQLQRQFLRLSASFAVRFRRWNSAEPWQTGKGINISSGGFCFTLLGAELPTLGARYESELRLRITHTQEVMLRMTAEVRWVSRTPTETTIGVRVSDPARCKDLTYVVSQLQHLMTHQPEDYLLVENQRPHLR